MHRKSSVKLRRKDMEILYRDELFMKLSMNVDDVFLMLDAQTNRADYVSPNAEKLLGITAEQIQEDVHVLGKLHPQESAEQTMNSLTGLAANEQREWDFEYIHQKTSEHRWFHVIAMGSNVEGRTNLWDKDTDELWSKVALGLDSSQEIRFPADKGLAGYVVKTGETVNIVDAYNDPRFNPEVDTKTGYRTKTILCMPIMNNNREIIGAFQVINKIDGIFTKNDEDLLIAIGGSASIALENAQLFDQQLQLYREQKLLFESFIDTLATSIDARDKITAGHSTRVKLYSILLADALGMNAKDKSLLEKAAILHDIGKIGIRDSVLQKDGKLTDEEYKHIQEHVRITHNILNKIYMSPDFRIITEMACSHHEKWDGTGYYRHLKGEEITLGGRILAVADVFDAITSKRHYRDKMPIANVLDILMKGAGSHFDKNLVDVFMSISTDKIVKVFLSESHGKIEPKDEEFLKRYDLMDIYRFVNIESPTDEQKHFLELFNKYYLGSYEPKEEDMV